MSADINLSSFERIGTIAPTPNHPIAARRAANVNILGVSLTFHLYARQGNRVLLNQFQGEVRMFVGDSKEPDAFFFPMRIERQSILSREHETNPNVGVEWYVSQTDFALIERSRGERPIRIELALQFVIQEMQQDTSTQVWIAVGTPMPRAALLGLTPAKEEWIGILRRLRIAELALFELPIPLGDSEQTDLNLALKKAIDHFYHGGTLGYKEVVANIRIAMEKAEPILGIPKFTDDWRKDGATRIERLFLNWHSLKKLTHLAHHEPDEWSRDEAQYVLTSFISFMNSLSGDGRCTGPE